MDKSDLLKIAYAAIIAVVFKEFLAWLISRSKSLGAMAAKISGKWISIEKSKGSRNWIRWIVWRIWPITILIVNGGFLVSCLLSKTIPASRYDVLVIIGSVYVVNKAIKYLDHLNSIE